MSVFVSVVIVNTNIEALGELAEIEQAAPDLETGLDLVTEMIWQGYTLYSITIQYDHYHKMNLSTSLFDGQVFSPHIQRLRQEWRAILTVE